MPEAAGAAMMLAWLIRSQSVYEAGLLLIMGSIGYLTSGCLTWLGRSVGIPGSEPAAPGTGPVDFHPRAERLAR